MCCRLLGGFYYMRMSLVVFFWSCIWISLTNFVECNSILGDSFYYVFHLESVFLLVGGVIVLGCLGQFVCIWYFGALILPLLIYLLCMSVLLYISIYSYMIIAVQWALFEYINIIYSLWIVPFKSIHRLDVCVDVCVWMCVCVWMWMCMCVCGCVCGCACGGACVCTFPLLWIN